MKVTFKNKNTEKIINLIVILLISFFIFKYILKFFAPFILGYILCLILYPITRFLVKNNISKGFASFLSIFIFLIVISFVGTNLVSKVVEQGKEFFEEIPFYLESIKRTINDIENFFYLTIQKMPIYMKNFIYSLYESLKFFIIDFLEQSFKIGSVGVIKKIPDFFMILIVSIASCFLMLLDKENIEKFVYNQIPKKFKISLKAVKEGIFIALFGYVKAQSIIMAIVATICFLGLTFIKIRYSLFLAFAISFIDALPILGSGIIFIPWVIYNLIIKNYNMSIALFIIYIIIVFTRQFFEHRIVGKQIGVHPLVTLISIYIGLKLLGFLGVIVGPIIAVIIKLLQDKDILPKWNQCI